MNVMLQVSAYQKHVIADGIICYHFSIFITNTVQGMMAYYLAKYFFLLNLAFMSPNIIVMSCFGTLS